MKLYYSTIEETDAEQKQPRFSLGGFISSTVVPNNSIENLFGDITPYTIRNNRDEYIAVMLKNTTGSTATGVTIWFEYPTIQRYKLLIAAVTPNANGEIEHIDNQYSQPYNATFYEADGVGNAVNIGDINDGDFVGLWIKRELLMDEIATLESDDYIEEHYNDTVNQDEVVSMKIDYT